MLPLDIHLFPTPHGPDQRLWPTANDQLSCVDAHRRPNCPGPFHPGHGLGNTPWKDLQLPDLPFNFWEFHTASFLAYETVQVGIALVTLAILSTLQIISFPSPILLSLGLCYCLLVSLFWFALQFLVGILGFWLEETWMIRVLLQIVITFLSGSIVPLEFFPSPLSTPSTTLPFPLWPITRSVLYGP